MGRRMNIPDPGRAGFLDAAVRRAVAVLAALAKGAFQLPVMRTGLDNGADGELQPDSDTGPPLSVARVLIVLALVLVALAAAGGVANRT